MPASPPGASADELSDITGSAFVVVDANVDHALTFCSLMSLSCARPRPPPPPKPSHARAIRARSSLRKGRQNTCLCEVLLRDHRWHGLRISSRCFSSWGSSIIHCCAIRRVDGTTICTAHLRCTTLCVNRYTLRKRERVHAPDWRPRTSDTDGWSLAGLTRGSTLAGTTGSARSAGSPICALGCDPAGADATGWGSSCSFGGFTSGWRLGFGADLVRTGCDSTNMEAQSHIAICCDAHAWRTHPLDKTLESLQSREWQGVEVDLDLLALARVHVHDSEHLAHALLGELLNGFAQGVFLLVRE